MLVFIICNMLNVIIQTAKTLITIKGGRVGAALINALAYGFYTYIVILMVSDMSTLAKCVIVGLCNLVGVYCVKLCEEKAHKDKLWKVELATDCPKNVQAELISANVSFNGVETWTDDYTIFNVFCENKEEFRKIKAIVKKYNCKTFVSETKTTI